MPTTRLTTVLASRWRGHRARVQAERDYWAAMARWFPSWHAGGDYNAGPAPVPPPHLKEKWAAQVDRRKKRGTR